ncbi:MAG: hypothetical protein F4X51_23005 [Gemmatimonadetes bacterium]|nr:hypothetical protein [Gemmatimonadota bacterium]
MADLTAHESESQRVEKVGQVYRDKDYVVLIEPQGDQLPDFLQAFRPDLIAHKGDEHIVVEVRTRGQVSDFPQVNELAKVVRNEVGWNRTVADLPKLENFSLISILGILISEIEELNNFSVNQMFVIVFLRHLTGYNFSVLTY